MTLQIVELAPATPLTALSDKVDSQGIVLISFQTRSFTPQESSTLVALHREWFTGNGQVHYVAHRPATRGSCIVAAHSAGDGLCQVASSIHCAKQAIAKGIGRIEPGVQHFVGDAIRPRFGPPSGSQQLIGGAMDWMGRLTNGYSVPFLPNILSTFGFTGLSKLFPMLQEAEAALIERFGKTLGHLLSACSTMGNGCTFCLYGHLYAANLFHFEEHGTVGPLAETEAAQLTALTDLDLQTYLRTQLSDSPWAEVLPMIERIAEIRAGSPSTDDTEAYLRQTILAWSLINECSLQSPSDIAPPFNPQLAWNRRLQRAYRQAREQGS
jgi:hypothetical protein